MPQILSRESLEAARDLAIKDCTTISLGVADQMQGPDDLVFGDDPLTQPGKFLAFYLDLERRGVLDNLKVLAGGKWYTQLRRRYEREALKMLTGAR